MKITLREITDYPTDTRRLVAWRNENSYAFPPEDLLTVDKHLDWYEEFYLTDPARVICMVLADNKAVGTIGLTIRHGKGEIGNMILGDKNYSRQGVMQEAVKQMLKAFDLDHYWLKVLPDNIACIRFYQKLGFTLSTQTRREGSTVYSVMDRRRYYEDLAEAMSRSTS